ncbi:purple acid phosphatase family protein [Aliicoccus persicus]|uniref:Purple acid Phosphatase, N-terminal domain n=1 Tax=Aliicoccus persicus TaxID=930138 RepID=A0A662Z1X9_9STAP|nr:metallophosphoesterase family protein [Aliicoccus persicus]SEV91598.1 Purple acid Phosphatase, N-terminal domain [Aliicoccus persicus]
MKSLKKLALASVLGSVVLAGVSTSALAQGEVTEETLNANYERANNPAYSEEAITENDGFEFDEDHNIIAVTIGGETAEVTQENPAVEDAWFNNTPNRITTNLTADPSTSMHFQWHTTEADEDAVLYVWEDGSSIEEAVEFTPEILEIEDAFHIQTIDSGNFVYAIMWDEEEDEAMTDDDEPFIAVDNPDDVLGYYTDEVFTEDNLLWLDKGYDNYSLALPYPAFTETAYKATAEDLTPNTVYHYAVGNVDGELSEEATFTTAAEDSEDFTFIHYTDTQNAFSSEHQRSEAEYSRSTVQSMLDNEDAQEAKFALLSGDIVNDDWNDTEWDLTLDALLPLNNAMPHLFVTGNHDNENFIDHINTDNDVEGMTSGVAYTSRYNGAQFIVLNTEQDNESDEEFAPAILENQLEWFEAQLQAAQEARENGEIDWVFVTYHRPLFSSSYHSLEDENVQLVRDDLMALLDEYDVDMVFNGHDHNLTVTNALVHNPDAFGNAEVGTQGETDGETTTFASPEGTVFFIPNTAGTKTYDAIYKNQDFEWILEEEDINETYEELFDYEFTEDDVTSYRELLSTEEQPFRSSFYSDGHSNARESNMQHYGVIDVTADAVTYKLYQVVGEDLENRETTLLHTYEINK